MMSFKLLISRFKLRDCHIKIILFSYTPFKNKIGRKRFRIDTEAEDNINDFSFYLGS